MAKVQALDREINDEQRLAQQVGPILEKRIAELQETFPERFGPVITETLKVQIKESQDDVVEAISPIITKSLKAQIKDSQDEVVEAIYPIMGKLIKKYIQKEIAKLSESVDARMRQMFSFKGFWQRFIYRIKGVKESEVVVQGLLPPVLEEIMVIENDSGLLLANYSIGSNTDPDLVAGMLTAIKAFVEDAYSKSEQDLEYIEYETFTLYLQSFKSFYIVVAISGVLNQAFKDRLNDAVLGFAVKIAEDQNYRSDQRAMQSLLEHHFHEVND
jgi:hypothetical protein